MTVLRNAQVDGCGFLAIRRKGGPWGIIVLSGASGPDIANERMEERGPVWSMPGVNQNSSPGPKPRFLASFVFQKGLS